MVPVIPDFIGDGLGGFFASIIDQAMLGIWTAAVALLRTAFEIIDQLLAFGDGSQLVSGGQPAAGAPFAELWPTLRWIGGAVAVGLFFWQLTLTMLRGGTGFWRAASGPFAYGIATALTLGIVAAVLGAAEGLSTLLLQQGLDAQNFRTILDNPDLAFGDNPELDSSVDSTVRAVLLGLIGLFGVLPAALGYALQMIFRYAVIIVLLATVPITAAGLLTNTTSAWFWRSVRWFLAAVLMKPALALVLVIGVNMLSAPTGLGALLAGTGVLLISLFCPLALFRLLAFVEPGTSSGATLRSSLSSRGGSESPSEGGGTAEQAHSSRFDAARAARGAEAGSAAGPQGAAAGGAAGGLSGGGAAGGGAGGGGAGGAAAGGAGAGAGGAGGGALGAVGLVSAAVGAAAAASTQYANTTMDATGVGWPQGGIGRGRGGGGAPGGSSSGGGTVGGSDEGYGSQPDGDLPPPDVPTPDLPASDVPNSDRPGDLDDRDGPPREWDGARRGEQQPPDRAPAGSGNGVGAGRAGPGGNPTSSSPAAGGGSGGAGGGGGRA